MINEDRQVRMYEVVKGSKEVTPIFVKKVTKLYVYKKNYHNHKIEKHNRKGLFRRYYHTSDSARKAALAGW